MFVVTFCLCVWLLLVWALMLLTEMKWQPSLSLFDVIMAVTRFSSSSLMSLFCVQRYEHVSKNEGKLLCGFEFRISLSFRHRILFEFLYQIKSCPDRDFQLADDVQNGVAAKLHQPTFFS